MTNHGVAIHFLFCEHTIMYLATCFLVPKGLQVSKEAKQKNLTPPHL